MLKEFFLKKMLDAKLKALPEADRERLVGTLMKNPEFFGKMAEEIKAKTAAGKSEMEAAKEVLETHREALQKLLS